jgi:methanogenic corrinoid protein MtbC1
MRSSRPLGNDQRPPALPVNGAALAEAIDAHAERVAARITERQFADDPTLAVRFGERGRRKCTEDARRHLEYLASAARADSNTLFADYAGWAKILLARLGLSDEDLARNLTLLRDVIRETLGAPHGDAAARIVESALQDLPAMPSVSEPVLSPGAPHAELAQRYLELLLAGDRPSASALILDAADRGVSVRDIYLHVFQRTQHEVGRRWQMNELTVAEEHFCTAATQLIMSQLYPRIFATPRVGRRLVAACVGGDLHEIGMRMVADFFEMAGWDTYYLGANTPLDGIVESVAQRRADALAISATMTYHVSRVGEVVRAVRERAGARAPRILVGGYPFRVDPALWKAIGADGFAADAAEAVTLANRLVSDA